MAQYGSMGGRFGSLSQRMDEVRHRRQFLESYRKKKENGDNVDAYYRREEMFHFGLLEATYDLDYVYSLGYSSDKGFTYAVGELSTKVKGMSYGAGVEFYTPLSKLSETSMIAMQFGMDMHYVKFKFEELRLSGGQRFTPSQDLIQTNFPIGMVYKTGTDAALRKSVKSGFSFGGGAAINWNASLSDDAVRSKCLIRPYGLAEVAFYTGICWKIRATGYMGNAILAEGGQNVGIGGSADDSRMRLQSKSSIMFSLIFFDLSWDWDEDY
jgi:hypothetical protein